MPGLHKITAFPLSAFCADAMGNIAANNDYSAVADTFFIQPSADQDFVISKLAIHFLFSGTQIVYDSYANIAGGLADGVTVQTYDTVNNAVIHDLTAGFPLKMNSQFLHLGSGFEVYGFSGNILSVTAVLDLSSPEINAPVTLKGANSEQLQFLLNDDFSTMLEHHFTVKGYINSSTGYRA